MGPFGSFVISASGMEAQRIRMNTIASNLANANSATTPDGASYRRKDVLFSTTPLGSTFQDVLNSRREGLSGVSIARIIEDQSPLKRVYEPSNPGADEEGYVEYPNVDVLKEMVNMMSASRSYEANITVFDASRTMALQALKIGS